MSVPTSVPPSAEETSIPTQSAGWIRGTVYTALFAALFVAFSSISVPLVFSPVPITLQTLAVMLAGGLLGPVYGFWSIAIVVILTAAGLPLLHGNGGLAVLYGPTGGYIWMFPFAALFIGWVSDRLFRGVRRLTPARFAILAVAVFAFGAILVYAGGVPWLAHKAHFSFGKAMATGCYPFLLGDTVKTVVATVAIGALRPLLPGFKTKGRSA
ncbi:biotin transporter BioY [Cohnella thermotolerans]|jgi:biotin transport system substrate-specific component|uniref:biotin transporter BioY n=1 Tax=Cohnella thermotolerans TaxID=329858 RepID=UPI0003FBB800|nr:biotin transporter BioY [Cohnella thermotolerans]